MATMAFKGTSGNNPQEVKNGQFIQRLDSWTYDSKWIWNQKINAALHTVGGTDDIQQVLAGITPVSVTYEINFTVVFVVSAGSLTVGFGSIHAGHVLTTSGSYTYNETFTNNNLLWFTPTTDFVGYVTGISIRKLKIQP